VPTPVAGIKPEVEQHAQATKRKKPAGDKKPWYKKIFGAKADAPAQSGMPLAIPVATGGGAELIASGMSALRGVTSIRLGSLFVNPVTVGVIGTFYSNKLNAGEEDILSDSQLAALAGKSAPTRIRFQWVKDKYGRLIPVAYHTGADSGLDQVRVRAMRRNIFTGNYEFWADGAEKPAIIWTPDELEFKAPGNTGNRDEPYLPSTITVLPLPGAEEMGSTSTSLPIPDEQSFDDYILVNLPHGMPPIYIYLSNDHKYHVAPKGNPPLPAFPDAKKAVSKTLIKGGGKFRYRWKDSKKTIYEWDSQHGTVEVYDKSGRNHLGEFDPVTGKQTKPADPARKVEK
jgi:pyocin large subunit-like protein